MVSAFVSGILGVILSVYIGQQFLSLSVGDVAHALIASNVAGFISLLLILNAQSQPSIKKWFLPTISMTWVFFVSIYASVTFYLGPKALDLRSFLYLLMPLILSNGFCIIAFGPIQDRIVRRRARARARASSK